MVSASFGQGTEDDGEEGRGRPNVAGGLTSAQSGLPTTPGAPVQGVAIAEGVVVGVPIDEAIERARRRLSGPIAADLAMDQPGVGDALVPASLGGDTDSAIDVTEGQGEAASAMQVDTTSDATDATASQADPGEGTFTWRIENFSGLRERKKYSENFEVGGQSWRLLIFPRGNGCDYVSLYLDVADTDLLPYNWTRGAQFTLTIVNQQNEERSQRKDANHHFHSKESDWGFTQFMSLEELYSDSKGFMENDTVVIEARVTIKESSYLHYDSRKETGHVGLKNQGATCYMNSLLQALFHIPYFRKAVYHMPTQEDAVGPPSPSQKPSIPMAMQSLFYKLQFSPHAVSTKDLTRSFGWDSMDAFTQHDVQELNRVLCEKLEEKMKRTSVENTIAKLFEGHVVNYIECINVDYQSTRKESFMDLQLDVKGCKNVYESFDKYVEVETLEGDNKYRAEGHGLQDARKGVLFQDFPPVLQLQLKRFEYDFVRDAMVKVNERYEFPEQLDLDRENFKYMTKDYDKSVRNQYTLYGVLVHSGGVHGGHYYAFIRPDGKQWLKFDDEKVTKVNQGVAIDEQFGGDGTEGTPPHPGLLNNAPMKFAKFSNAYMLVYIRDCDRDSILCDVSKDDIDDDLRERLEKEQEEKERRKKEKQEAHLYTYVKIATDSDITTQVGSHIHFDLVDFDHADVLKLRLQKQIPFLDLKKEVEAKLGIPLDKQRYWMWATRENRTYRPSRMIGPEEDNSRIFDLKEPSGGMPKNTLNLFLETPANGQDELPPVRQGDILLFFKMYDPHTQTLKYVGRTFTQLTSKVRDLSAQMCQFAHFPLDEDLMVFEEIKNEPAVMCERIERHSSLHKCQLEDGDIICFQKDDPGLHEPSSQSTGAGGGPVHVPLVPDFMNYIKNRQVVCFTKFDKHDDVIKLELSKLNTYNEVVERLAHHIDLDDPAKIRLTAHNSYSNGPRQGSVKYQGVEKLSDMLVHYQQASDVLYYEILDIPLFELERLKSLKITYHDEKTAEVETYTLRLPMESKVEEVLQELRRRIPNGANERLRLMEVFYHKIYKVFDENDKIEGINDQYWTLRAEAVSEEERNMSANDRVIHVYHFTQRDNGQNTAQMTNFGNPFFFVVHEGERLAQVKERIKAKLNVPDEEFAKWKVAFCSMSRPDYLDDDDILITRFMRRDSYGPWEHYLGLEHECKDPKARGNSNQGRAYGYDKPIKIYN